MCRRKEVSKAEVRLAEFFDNRADTISKLLVRDDNSFKTESGCKTWDKCLFPHYMVEEQPSNKPKKELQPSKRKERRQGEL